MAKSKTKAANAGPSLPVAPRVHWTTADETALIVFLDDHKSEAGDGMSFKMATWNAAAVSLAGQTTKGAPKDGLACKNKWARVRWHIVLV